MKRAMILIGLALVAGEAFAQTITAEYLHERWLEYKAGHSNSLEGFYVGYVIGVTDAANVEGKYFVLPTGTTNRQILAIIGKFLDAEPQTWNESADVVIVATLHHLYPPPE